MYYRIFDCWRLTAALLVMAYHFLYFAPPGGEVAIAFLRRLLPLLDMFFMISGFFITSRYATRLSTVADYGVFMQRRIARLYPLHLATTVFFTVIALAVWAGLVATTEPERWDLSVLPLHLFALHALGATDHLTLNYVSWSVSAEFFCYLLFPLIVVAIRRAGLAGLVILLAAWLVGLEIAGAQGVFPQGHWTRADTFGAYRAFADFVIGAIVAVLARRRIFDVRSIAPGLSVLALAVTGMILEWNPYVSLAGLAVAMLLVALAETARPDSTAALSFLMPVTRVSFGIYLLHPVVETIFLSILWKRVIEPTGLIGFYAYWILPMLATIALAMLSERLFEKRLGAFFADVGRPGQKERAAAV
ncbi:MAG: acyltransferase [Rhizobiaceae bacterium]|nr:acyltransferase [Rhizobiaceae bacterium]